MSSSMDQKLLDSSVYNGLWMNWSRGAIFGMTLTLNNRDGGLLTAFLALFVTFTGTCFWRIVCFALHFILSVQIPSNGLYHQHQAIFRNSSTALNGIRQLIAASWAWHGIIPRVHTRTLPLLGIATMIAFGFAVATIFSSKISTLTGDEVLLRGDPCIVAENTENATQMEMLLHLNALTIGETTAASAYADECYSDGGHSQNCNTFVRRSLTASIDQNAGCPFSSGVCLMNSSNIIMDTGYINSHDDLGINAPPQDRFALRQTTHCAPIKINGYHRSRNLSSTCEWHEYYYSNTSQATISCESCSSNRSADILTEYVVRSTFAIDPIPELQADGADTELFFLAAPTMHFVEPVDDPWYSAHRSNTQGTIEYYLKDEFMSVIGCTTQQSLCNPNVPFESGCLDFNWGRNHGEIQESNIWKTENQRAAVKILSHTAHGSPLSGTVNVMGAFSLLSRRSSANRHQSTLPDNQWQLEVQNWFNTSLSLLQRQIVEQTAGRDNDFVAQHSTRPGTAPEWARCRGQKVKSTSYTSFSVLGLSITFAVGGLIMVVSYTLESLVAYALRRKKTHLYQRLEWSINETLQLQRLAHEEIGCGTWHKTQNTVPTTDADEKLAVVDTSEPEHPRLAAPGLSKSQEDISFQPPSSVTLGPLPESTSRNPSCSETEKLAEDSSLDHHPSLQQRGKSRYTFTTRARSRSF